MNVDYRAIFFMGLALVATGVVFLASLHPAIGIAFTATGAANMAIGLANRGEWKD